MPSGKMETGNSLREGIKKHSPLVGPLKVGLLSVNNQHNPPDHIMNKDEEMQKKAKMPTNPKMQKNAKKNAPKKQEMQKIQQKILNVNKAENAKKCITTCGASPPWVHHHLQCITTYSASPPSVHFHLQCIST